jgi:hypothetical protein
MRVLSNAQSVDALPTTPTPNPSPQGGGEHSESTGSKITPTTLFVCATRIIPVPLAHLPLYPCGERGRFVIARSAATKQSRLDWQAADSDPSS